MITVVLHARKLSECKGGLLPCGLKESQMDGFVIRPRWINEILAGRKIWEIRGSSTRKRGLVALIESGTGTVVGVARLERVEGPLGLREFAANARKHRSNIGRELPYRRTFAWVLKFARRLQQPVRYRHPMGAVIWVKLAPAVQRAIERQL